ncbi:MAG: riboflavin biosynthesis protein RibF [Ruminococcaceae bacterium]|nr:riboflavin biosynthesis protein RibF [Oscillospiraceae bacterium]
MRVLHLKDAVIASPQAIALGYFDGGHRGHQALLERTLLEARRLSCESAVFSFSHLPTKEGSPLFSVEDRLAFFEKAGIQNVILASFEELRSLSPEAFISSVLKESCHARLALCGFNFRFGYMAAGDAALLARFLPESVILPPMLYENAPISATRIRGALSRGDIEAANAMLGHPYTVSGTVTHGRTVGRTLGFPTANVAPLTMLPRHGVYKTSVEVDGILYKGVSDVGVRPTVEEGGEERVETFLKDFSGDLYEKTLKISFFSFLREEKRFSSLAELKAQLSKDIQDL